MFSFIFVESGGRWWLQPVGCQPRSDFSPTLFNATFIYLQTLASPPRQAHRKTDTPSERTLARQHALHKSSPVTNAASLSGRLLKDWKTYWLQNTVCVPLPSALDCGETLALLISVCFRHIHSLQPKHSGAAAYPCVFICIVKLYKVIIRYCYGWYGNHDRDKVANWKVRFRLYLWNFTSQITAVICQCRNTGVKYIFLCHKIINNHLPHLQIPTDQLQALWKSNTIQTKTKIDFNFPFICIHGLKNLFLQSPKLRY